ncbi:alpha/beta fold hydrolase [Acidiferrimicrobium sp. IK]|uniref:alpha/beta fold hydrolase n=1 Tax=Acidiferrimicrobium sp. IK TaxID=2871700 RepID=UPI0021CB906D|nr:alpha/beta fold hydrolase [Acidiferrimicrobium sp. IK]MCU4183645.1 alpha/beta fold hydrolase [Acidiferrimicrobium sp. IK]
MPDTGPLHIEEWGAGPTVGLVHGFTQSAASWEPVAGRLADRWRLVAVDAPGHGRSAAVNTDLWEGAELIGATVGPASYVGYSMGGRLALHLALARPDLVDALVLVSATAGIDDPEERAARRAADERLAERVEAEGVEAFVAWWLTRPLFATLPAASAAIESRLGGSAAGLASSLRLAGTGTQQPLWDRLGELAMPVLVIAGSLDGAYTERAQRLAAGIGPGATLEVLAGAGHACHLEQPEAFASTVREWLTGVAHPDAR